MAGSLYDRAEKPRILIVTAVDAEADAVRSGLDEHTRDIIDIHVAGVGPAAAAASTAARLASVSQGYYKLVISAGIGGGFAPHAPIGSMVLASSCIAADLGSETPEQGFISVDELGFGHSFIQTDDHYTDRLKAGLQNAGIPVHVGPVLTVSTTTGSAATTTALLRRMPDAAAEGMEGFGVASAARLFQLPVMELRAISNLVGPRDRDSWRIGEALQSLGRATRILTEVF